MCECRNTIEEKLMTRFKESSPEATGHRVSLDGYTIVIGHNQLMIRSYMTYKMEAEFPLKKGGMKAKKITGNMILSYCPFCGEKYKEDAA